MSWRYGLLLVMTNSALACACGGTWPSVKQAWQAAPGVFVGTVEIADPDEDASQTIFQKQFVRIRVDEAFKGVSAGQLIELHQGASDCDAKFRSGERAVFYLYPGRTAGSWGVPWCSHAMGSAEPMGDDLLFLRRLPQSAIGTRLSGEVKHYEESPTEGFKKLGGVPNVRVKISGPRGFTQEVLTNSVGVYEVYGLRPGSYSVTIDAPSGLKIRFPVVTGSAAISSDSHAVELARDGGASVSFVLEADTRLSGRMLDANGRPVRDVCIDLEPMESRGENGARFFDCSKDGGVFQMDMMPPGKYWLVARDVVEMGMFRSKSTLYYAGVRDREQATMISIKAGNYLKNLEIRLPSQEKRFKLTGRLEFSDGIGVAKATITFTSPEHGYSEMTDTDMDGVFRLSVVAGMVGQVTGQIDVLEPILKSCPDFRVEPRRRGMFRLMRATPLSVSIDSDRSDIKLNLPSPSCNAWPRSHK